MRRLLILAAGVACAAALSACGAFRNQITPAASLADPLSVELSATPGAGQVGILAAQSDGSLERAGVRLALRPTATPASPLQDVEDGRVDVAVVAEPALMLARSADHYVLGFASLTQSSSDALVSLHPRPRPHAKAPARPVTSLAGLRGRRVGVTGQPYETAVLDAALKDADVPPGSVQTVDVGSGAAAALTSGRVAATFTGGLATALALRDAHRRVDVLSLGALHIPAYSDLVFVTRETFFAQHVNLLRRFAQAVGRGYAAVRADPAAGVAALAAAGPSVRAAAGPATASVTAALASAFPDGGRPWGWQVQSRWNALGRWMTGRHLISGPPAWYDASTNQLLAGQGP